MAPVVLAIAATGASVAGLSGLAAGLALVSVVASYEQQRSALAKNRVEVAREKARRELERLQSSRAVVELPIAPRERIYGRTITAGTRVYVMADRTPSSATDRAQNSHLFMLSDVPITRFRSVIFREVYLGDFTGLDGAADDSEILKYVVPWSAGPPVIIGPQPSGADPRFDAGLTDSRYEYAGTSDADDLANLADATLYAFLGSEDTSKVQLPPCIFSGAGAGLLLGDREVLDSDGNRTGGFLALGCAWANARTYQTNPETGQGIGSVSGTRGFVWEVEGAGMRDWRPAGSGRFFFGNPLTGDGRLTTLSQADGLVDFEELGMLDSPDGDVFVFGNPATKAWRDAIVVALGGEVVDHPPAAGADEDVLIDGADLNRRQTLHLPRPITDYESFKVVVNDAAGEQVGTTFFINTKVLVASGATLGVSHNIGNEIIRLWPNATSSFSLDYDLAGSVAASGNTMSIVGRSPVDDRIRAETAYAAFETSEINRTALRQLPLACSNLPPSYLAVGSVFVSADRMLALAAEQMIEEAWFALPRTYSANPVVAFMDWVMSPARPSGFQVGMEEQLALLPELTREANECDRLIDIGNFVLQSDVQDAMGVFESAASYDYVGKVERNVDPDEHYFVTIGADGTETLIAGSEFGGGIRWTGPGRNADSKPESGSGSFTHNGLVYNFRWNFQHEQHGEEDHGFLNLRTRDTFRPRWSVEMDRFNEDIVMRGDGGTLVSAVKSSLEIPEEVANPLAAAFCTVPVVFMSVTKADGSVTRVSRRLAEVQFVYAVSEYKWEIPEGTLTIAVTRLASGRLGTTMTVTPDSGITAVVVTSAHLEICMRKFEFNDRVSAGESERRNLERFGEAAVGDIWDEGLALRFRVARWSPPVTTIRTRDFAAELEAQREEDGEAHDIFTDMKAVFRDSANNWLEAETLTVKDDISRERNGGFESRLDIVTSSANSRWRATTLVNQHLILERARRTIQLRPLRFGFGFLQRGDRIVLDMAEYGFDNVVFQVRQTRTERNGLTLFLREDREEWYSDALFQAGDGSCGLFCGVGLTDDDGMALTDDAGAALVS